MAVSVFSPTFDEKWRVFFTSGNNSIRVGTILCELEKFQGFSGGRSQGLGYETSYRTAYAIIFHRTTREYLEEMLDDRLICTGVAK